MISGRAPFQAHAAVVCDHPIDAELVGDTSLAGLSPCNEAIEVARRLAAGETESPLMPLDETISIMETMDTVLAQAGRDA